MKKIEIGEKINDTMLKEIDFTKEVERLSNIGKKFAAKDLLYTGYTLTTIRKRLNSICSEGKLIKTKSVIDGNYIMVYRKRKNTCSRDIIMDDIRIRIEKNEHFTISDVAKSTGMSNNTVNSYIRELLDLGTLEYMISDGNQKHNIYFSSGKDIKIRIEHKKELSVKEQLKENRNYHASKGNWKEVKRIRKMLSYHK